MIETRVTKAEDLLASCAATNETKNDSNITDNNKSTSDVKTKSNKATPRGKPKSGRVWKEPKQRFKSIVKTKGLQISVDKKKKLRDELRKVKELSREIKSQKAAEKQAKKERRKENLKRQEENEKKSEVVQVIKNTAKIKRMKKKQLRMIEKRDTTKVTKGM